jgi:hypothetical protein
MPEDRPKQKFGGKQPGAGRPSKAQEFGLADLMLRAWPDDVREKNITHIASLISPDTVEGKYGPFMKVDPKVQVAALELLLKYGYGTPKAIDVTVDFDLNADIDGMTPEQREVHKLKILAYIARKGIQI